MIGGDAVRRSSSETVAPEQLVEQVTHRQDEVVQVERHGMIDAATTERHQVVGQRRGAVGRALHRVDAGSRTLEHGQVVLEQLDLSAHDRQHVVEVVGDAARQAPDRLHLLRVDELLLQTLALGDVVDDDDLELGRPGGVGASELR